MDDSRWHILRVKPGREDAVAAVCGVPAYVPRRRVKAFNRKLRKVVCYVKALIPGFVFVLISTKDEMRWLPRREAFGVLRNGDQTPATLTPKAFEALRRVEAEANAAKEPEIAPVRKPIKIGEKVGVHMALFSEAVTALVEEIKGNKVLLRVLKSNLRVETTLDKAIRL